MMVKMDYVLSYESDIINPSWRCIASFCHEDKDGNPYTAYYCVGKAETKERSFSVLMGGIIDAFNEANKNASVEDRTS